MNAPYADVPEILVVDDDPALLRLMQLRLEGAGLRVRVADSGERALALLAVKRPRVVVTDLLMPGMDGMALFNAIRVENPALPVIILTAHGSIPEAVSAVKGGVFGFLAKPFDAPTLLTEIERALGAAGIPAGPTTDSQAWRAAILTRNPVMEEVLAKARLVASADAPVLICGDSGTGKELLARAIHAASPRAGGPFVAINCGAMPEALLESELFGHVRGAFTGAVRDHRGLLAEADGGTLLLDEIGDMPPALQVKLLPVLQEQAGPAGGQCATPAGQCAHRVSHASRSRCGTRAGAFPGGSLLSPERGESPVAAPLRATRGHTAFGGTLCERTRTTLREAAHGADAGVGGIAAAGALARQCPSALQRGGAGSCARDDALDIRNPCTSGDTARTVRV